MPEGAFLKTLRQEERRVTLVGLAQSNERISDLLRALANESPWLERPELVEIKAVALGGQQAGKAAGSEKVEPRRVYEFSINALIRGANAEPAAGGVNRPAVPGKVAQAGVATAPGK
jgi:type IV pilus assembly protein PilN